MSSQAVATGPTGSIARLVGEDPLLFLLRASLVGLVVISNDDPWIFGAAALTSIVALPLPRLMRNPWLWAALFTAIGLRQLATWHTIDDHTIVMTYWCGAVALGLRATDPAATLAASARYIIGTLFALAAGWKLLSGQFLDGTFFRYSLLFDDRFEFVADVVGGTSRAVHEANVDEVSRLLSRDGTGTAVLEEGTRNVILAQAFTWWGVAIEAAVALVFLAPLPLRWGWLRHAVLVAFAATTYLIVPIGGFGTLLLVLGAAMATSDRGRTAYYLGAAGLLLWAGLWPLLFLS